MAGIGKLFAGTFLFVAALFLSFTIIGIFLALPIFSAAFGLWTAGLLQLGIKSARAVSSLKAPPTSPPAR